MVDGSFLSKSASKQKLGLSANQLKPLVELDQRPDLIDQYGIEHMELVV